MIISIARIVVFLPRLERLAQVGGGDVGATSAQVGGDEQNENAKQNENERIYLTPTGAFSAGRGWRRRFSVSAGRGWRRKLDIRNKKRV